MFSYLNGFNKPYKCAISLPLQLPSVSGPLQSKDRGVKRKHPPDDGNQEAVIVGDDDKKAGADKKEPKKGKVIMIDKEEDTQTELVSISDHEVSSTGPVFVAIIRVTDNKKRTTEKKSDEPAHRWLGDTVVTKYINDMKIRRPIGHVPKVCGVSPLAWQSSPRQDGKQNGKQNVTIKLQFHGFFPDPADTTNEAVQQYDVSELPDVAVKMISDQMLRAQGMLSSLLNSPSFKRRGGKLKSNTLLTKTVLEAFDRAINDVDWLPGTERLPKYLWKASAIKGTKAKGWKNLALYCIYGLLGDTQFEFHQTFTPNQEDKATLRKINAHIAQLMRSMAYATEIICSKVAYGGMADDLQSHLKRLVSSFVIVYGEYAATPNVGHAVFHLVDAIRAFGPLWVSSVWAFERSNGIIARIPGNRRRPEIAMLSMYNILSRISYIKHQMEKPHLENSRLWKSTLAFNTMVWHWREKPWAIPCRGDEIPDGAVIIHGHTKPVDMTHLPADQADLTYISASIKVGYTEPGNYQ